VLVANAGPGALLSHATSPDALEQYLNDGVTVFTSSRLHAKVIVTAQYAAVGSANASANSTRLTEAVLVTDDARVVAAASQFIDGLGDLTQVDRAFLDGAREMWNKGRGGGPPGTDGGHVPSTRFPSSTDRMYLARPIFYLPSPAEREVYRKGTRGVRHMAGPSATYELDSFRQHRDDDPFRLGDVVLQCTMEDGEPWLWPPQEVISPPLPIPRSRSVIQLLRDRIDLLPMKVTDATEELVAYGRRSDDLTSERWITNKNLRDALFNLWGLPK